jgi:aryl-alcohol dehydrogenase-like predicted oxidoreductase
MLDNSIEKLDLIKEAKQKGKIIQARSIFLQGLFFKNLEENEIVIQKLQNELLEIKRISKQNKIPLNEMALNYVLQNDCIDYIVLGVDNLLHLKKNIEALDKSLHQQIINEIDAINTENKFFLNPSNW